MKTRGPKSSALHIQEALQSTVFLTFSSALGQRVLKSRGTEHSAVVSFRQMRNKVEASLQQHNQHTILLISEYWIASNYTSLNQWFTESDEDMIKSTNSQAASCR